MLFRSNDTATTEIYTLSLHDALPIYAREPAAASAFLDFLLAPASARVIKAKGHEPARGGRMKAEG